jgi:hypothetical protein
MRPLLPYLDIIGVQEAGPRAAETTSQALATHPEGGQADAPSPLRNRFGLGRAIDCFTGLVWARRCRLPAFVKLAHSITEHRAGIEAALVHDLSNARVESSSP